MTLERVAARALVRAKHINQFVDKWDESGDALAPGNDGDLKATVGGVVTNAAPPGVSLDWYSNPSTAVAIAKSRGVPVIGRGTYALTETLVLDHDADFSGATITVADGSLTALRIGVTGTAGATNIRNRHIIAPKVVRTGRTSGTWGAGVGVEIANCHTCFITIPRVEGFGVGLLETAYGANGTVHNHITLGTLLNNKVGQRLTANDDDAWVNSNIHYGGQWQHGAGEGTAVSGARHLELLISSGIGNDCNMNLWTGFAFENNTKATDVLCQGSYNTWMPGRWESTTPTVIFDGQHGSGSYNVIQRGMGSHLLADNGSEINTAEGNALAGERGELHPVYGSTGLFLRNTSSNASPVIAIGDTDGDISDDLSIDWYWRLSADHLRGKRLADTHPRWQVDTEDGWQQWGPGSGAFDVGMYRDGVGILRIDGVLRLLTGLRIQKGSDAQPRLRIDDTYGWIEWGDGANVPDVGMYRAADGSLEVDGGILRAMGGLRNMHGATGGRPTGVTGLQYFDATLGIPIWYDGSGWVDATGTTV